MARPWRIEFEGALYHILSRGNQRQDIFRNDADHHLFLDTLGQMASCYDIDIYAYVLMGNHYHLLLKTHNANLSKAMQWFGTTYTRRFNIDHNCSGHLFQGRFKSFIVQNDAYLTQLSCYIHRNPLRAGIVQRLADYRWSSYPVYAYRKKSQAWLNTGLILSQFGTQNPHQAYRKKVQNYSGEEASLFEDLRYGLFLGTNSYADRLKKQFVKATPQSDLPQKVRLVKDINTETTLDKLAQALNCRVDKFRKSLRISNADKMNRDLMLYLLWNSGIFKNREIGELLGLSYSSVSRRAAMVRQSIQRDERLLKKVQQLSALIKL
ncbi:transposase [Thermodesulfobacteriota bacterium]